MFTELYSKLFSSTILPKAIVYKLFHVTSLSLKHLWACISNVCTIVINYIHVTCYILILEKFYLFPFFFFKENNDKYRLYCFYIHLSHFPHIPFESRLRQESNTVYFLIFLMGILSILLISQSCEEHQMK